MKIEITGLDSVKRSLADLSRRAQSLHGEHRVEFSELFSDDFMRRFTDFGTLDQMFAASGFKVESTADFERISADKWDAFVIKKTRCPSWEEMKAQAGSEWASRKVGF